MRRLASAAILGTVAMTAPVGVFAASPGMATHATLKVVKGYMHNMHFAHAMASATLKYAKSDVTIKVTADNLPMPSTLHKMAYVVYATDGKMTARIGALKIHGAMAGVTGQVMMSKVQDLYVYAESSAADKHPMGIKVLAGMVG